MNKQNLRQTNPMIREGFLCARVRRLWFSRVPVVLGLALMVAMLGACGGGGGGGGGGGVTKKAGPTRIEQADSDVQKALKQVEGATKKVAAAEVECKAQAADAECVELKEDVEGERTTDSSLSAVLQAYVNALKELLAAVKVLEDKIAELQNVRIEEKSKSKTAVIAAQEAAGEEEEIAESANKKAGEAVDALDKDFRSLTVQFEGLSASVKSGNSGALENYNKGDKAQKEALNARARAQQAWENVREAAAAAKEVAANEDTEAKTQALKAGEYRATAETETKRAQDFSAQARKYFSLAQKDYDNTLEQAQVTEDSNRQTLINNQRTVATLNTSAAETKSKDTTASVADRNTARDTIINKQKAVAEVKLADARKETDPQIRAQLVEDARKAQEILDRTKREKEVVADATLKVKQVVGGTYHTCARAPDGKVFCWGRNHYGQLGYGDKTDRSALDAGTPVDLGASGGTDYNAVYIAAGGATTCAILNTDADISDGYDRKNNKLKCWGRNVHGQAGLNVGYQKAAIRSAPEYKKRAIGDEAGEMGDNLLVIPLGTESLVAGAKKEDESLSDGGSFFPDRVTVGASHVCAVSSDEGQVKCWGDNRHGQLGIGVNANTKMYVGDEPGELGGSLKRVPGLYGVKEIAAGEDFSCAVQKKEGSNETGAAICWGRNHHVLGSAQTGGDRLKPDLSKDWVKFGQNSDDQFKPDNTAQPESVHVKQLAAGALHVCALVGAKDEGSLIGRSAVYCWGSYYRGSLGVGVGRNNNPPKVAALWGGVWPGTNEGAQIVEVVAGARHSCGRRENGQVQCWGEATPSAHIVTNHTSGYRKQAGPVVPLGTDDGNGGNPLFAKSLGAGGKNLGVNKAHGHTCVVVSADNNPNLGAALKCWGTNNYGQLGIGQVGTHYAQLTIDRSRRKVSFLGRELQLDNSRDYANDYLGDHLPFVTQGGQ